MRKTGMCYLKTRILGFWEIRKHIKYCVISFPDPIHTVLEQNPIENRPSRHLTWNCLVRLSQPAIPILSRKSLGSSKPLHSSTMKERSLKDVARRSSALLCDTTAVWHENVYSVGRFQIIMGPVHAWSGTWFKWAPQIVENYLSAKNSHMMGMRMECPLGGKKSHLIALFLVLIHLLSMCKCERLAFLRIE